MPRSRCCIRRATTTTGYCAPNCIGAAARTAASTTAPTAIRRMLSHLQLRDLVLVDQAELEFGPGLTALTGETGAGKSIVVDALLLIAGGRAGADVVRQGAERAEISASFAALSGAAGQWLEAQAIEHEGEVIVRRSIGADGRSRAYVNGQMVPLQALRELAEHLIEIHGQQEFQHLVNRGAQREMLDEHMANPALLDAVSGLHERHRVCRRDFESLKAAAENRDARLDLLRYQLEELKAEVTTVAAIEELCADQKRVAGRGCAAPLPGGTRHRSRAPGGARTPRRRARRAGAHASCGRAGASGAAGTH